MKTCTKCDTEKGLSCFSKNQSHCKACKRAYYMANKVKILAQDKRRYHANRDARVARMRSYKEENKEACLASCRAYKAANKDAVKADSRRYYAENAERQKAAVREWTSKNRGKVNSYGAKRRAAKRGTEVKDCPRVAALYRIAACLREDGYDVHVDHIVPIVRGGSHTFENLQILTATANLQKGSKL